MDLQKYISNLAKSAREASRQMAVIDTDLKNDCLRRIADEIENRSEWLKKENEKDIKEGKKKNLSSSLIDRLTLTDKRVKAMSEGLREVAELEDPVGKIIEEKRRPNGLLIKKIRVPLGTVAIIYESRPNVTVDAAGLCLKSGNAVILRGGKEAMHSNKALAVILSDVLKKTGMPEAVKLVEVTDREAVGILLKQDQFIDVVIPRGGEGLIRRVAEDSLIPVIKHYKGVCHLYVDEVCDPEMAKNVVINAKVQRPGVCNAIETLLVHRSHKNTLLPEIIHELQKNNVEIRGDDEVCEIVPGVKKATEDDWYEEFLDLILAVRVVSNLEEAIDHINKYGSNHSDGIITTNEEHANHFLKNIDSSAVYHNASTRFTDGFEFGLGAEIGISTDKIHARGPMGLEELTIYKFIVYGEGQVRE